LQSAYELGLAHFFFTFLLCVVAFWLSHSSFELLCVRLFVSFSSLVHGEGIIGSFLLAISVFILGIVENLAAVENMDWNARSVRHIGWKLCDLSDCLHTFNNLAKDNMLAV